MIPFAEKVLPHIGVPRLEVLGAGHFPHHVQQRPPALLLDGAAHHRPDGRSHVLRAEKGYLEVRGQVEQGLRVPAPFPLYPLGPQQGQGVGQVPRQEIPAVMFLPAAETEAGEYQRRHSVHDFASELLAPQNFLLFRVVERPHAAGQLPQGGTAQEQVVGQDVDQGQIAERGVVGQFVGNGHDKTSFLSVIYLYLTFNDISIYFLFPVFQ